MGTDCEKGTSTILVIEDDHAIMEFLEIVLGEEGYKVIVCDKGLQALSHLQTNCVDAVICDIMLPDVNGEDVAHSIRDTFHWHSLPIVFITAGMLPVGFLLDPWTFSLAKPFVIDQLLTILSSALLRSERTKSC